jgi:hypothetical protein
MTGGSRSTPVACAATRFMPLLFGSGNIMSKSAEERGKRGEKLCLRALLLRLKVSKSHVVAKGPMPITM